MKKSLGVAAAILLLAGGALAYRATVARPERADCPGKIHCPLTGDLIRKDQCPLGADQAPAADAAAPAKSCCGGCGDKAKAAADCCSTDAEQ